MKVFVISLPESAIRRRSSGQQLDRAGIAFEFFDAISGELAIHDGIVNAIDEASYVLNAGRDVVLGEIGCFASHRALWNRCVKLNEPIVIMEDDFELSPKFASALRATQEIISAAGFVRLQTTLRARQARIGRAGEFSLSRFVKAPHGMMCYCLSPAVAARFLSATRVVDAPVDVFMKKYWEHGQPLYALTPFTVTPSVLSEDTTIAGRIKKRKPFRVAQRRFLRKLGWYWKRWMFNLRMSLGGDPVLSAIRPASGDPRGTNTLP